MTVISDMSPCMAFYPNVSGHLWAMTGWPKAIRLALGHPDSFRTKADGFGSQADTLGP